jgi:hypothetical protein
MENVIVKLWLVDGSKKTDAELLAYFNNSPEGKRASCFSRVHIVFLLKNKTLLMYLKLKILAKRIWDSIIIPSALVKKAGSDFDIDKLSMYLKNLFSDNAGRLKVVPFLR